MPEYIHTLVATLGGQPQIVTFTLDLLLQRDFPISEVILLHPQASDKRLQNSITRLYTEFVGDYYLFRGQSRRCRLRSHALRLNEIPLDDIVDNPSAKGALDSTHRLISDLKRQHRCIHLSVTGGRRLISLLATSAAHLHFDHLDHIWHIYTPHAIQQTANEGAFMHVPTDAGVNLIDVPFVPWRAYFPHLSQLATMDAQSTRRTQEALIEAEKRKHCDDVVKQAKPRELAILRAFAKGMNPQEVASYLSISIKTVDTYKTVLLSLCRISWNKGINEIPNYRFLQQAFATYFADDDGSIYS